MLRTLSVLVGGMLLALAVLIVCFLFITKYIPAHSNWYAYFVLKALVGATVGLFVGFLQKRRRGLVAAMCLLPGFLLQIASRPYPIRTAGGFLALLLSEVLGLLIALLIVRRLSDAGRASPSVSVSAS